MSDAKQCDNCRELYTKPKDIDDPHVVTVKQRDGWKHPAIGARISLYNELEHDLIDDCRKCTVLAVRKFMHKFGITEDNGGARFRFMPKVHGKQVRLESPVEGEGITASRFFDSYLGQKIEVTVRVL